jgi:hypothetical protein
VEVSKGGNCCPSSSQQMRSATQSLRRGDGRHIRPRHAGDPRLFRGSCNGSPPVFGTVTLGAAVNAVLSKKTFLPVPGVMNGVSAITAEFRPLYTLALNRRSHLSEKSQV